MKIKALRKIESKEFLEIINMDGTDVVFSSTLPRPLNPEATAEIICEYYKKTYPHVDLSHYEMVEFELTETNVVKLV
jgi:hypothetical protein